MSVDAIADHGPTVTNNNGQEAQEHRTEQSTMGIGTEYGDQGVETESNCSMEDTVAKLEHALRKNFKAQSGEEEEEDDHGYEIPTQGSGGQAAGSHRMQCVTRCVTEEVLRRLDDTASVTGTPRVTQPV